MAAPPPPPGRERYSMFLRTVQGGAVKTLFEVLKEIVHEVALVFGPDGVKLTQVDGAKIAMANLRLKADAFEEFHCPREVQAGVNTGYLFKLLRTTSSSDTITMYMEAAREDLLVIQIQNADKNSVTDYELTLMDVTDCRIKPPDMVYDCVFTLPSATFQRLCREAAGLSNVLTISSEGATLELSCRGDHVRQRTVIGEAADGLSVSAASTSRVRNDFQLRFLTMFCKASGLCNVTEILLKQDYPAVFKYNVASLGELKFMLSPYTGDDFD